MSTGASVKRIGFEGLSTHPSQPYPTMLAFYADVLLSHLGDRPWPAYVFLICAAVTTVWLFGVRRPSPPPRSSSSSLDPSTASASTAAPSTAASTADRPAKYVLSRPPDKLLWDELSRPALIVGASSVVLWQFPLVKGLLIPIAALNLLYFSMRGALADQPRLEVPAAMRRLVAQCPSLHRAYRPTLWAFHTRIQSTMFALWPFPLWVWRGGLVWRRQNILCRDGGSVGLDWLDEVHNAGPCAAAAGSTRSTRSTHNRRRADPILVICPGIIGNVNDQYIKRKGEGNT